MFRKVCQVLAVCGATLGVPGAVWALTVEVRAPEAVAEDIRNASLSAALLKEENAVRPIDVISAAQADYARLIGLL